MEKGLVSKKTNALMTLFILSLKYCIQELTQAFDCVIHKILLQKMFFMY